MEKGKCYGKKKLCIFFQTDKAGFLDFFFFFFFLKIRAKPSQSVVRNKEKKWNGLIGWKLAFSRKNQWFFCIISIHFGMVYRQINLRMVIKIKSMRKDINPWLQTPGLVWIMFNSIANSLKCILNPEIIKKKYITVSF